VLVQQPGIGGYLQGALALGLPFLLLTYVSRRLPATPIVTPLLCSAALTSTALFSDAPVLSLIKGAAWGSLFILVALTLSESDRASGDWLFGANSAESAVRILGAVVPFFLAMAVLASLLLGGGFLIPEATGIPQLTPTLLSMHPNTFSLYLVLGVLVLIWERGAAWGMRDVLGVSSLVAMMLMTRSRTALVLLAVGLLVLMVTRGGKRARWAGGFVVLVTGVAIALEVVPVDFLMRGQGESEVTQLSGRLPLWDAALAGMRERPWLGWGYGVGPEIAIERHATTFLAYSVSTSDNMYLDVALAGGTVLLVVWVLLVLALIAKVIRGSRGASNQVAFLAAATAVLLTRTGLGSGFDVLGPIAFAFYLIWLGASAATAGSVAARSRIVGRQPA
jgi:O-antigen ligase